MPEATSERSLVELPTGPIELLEHLRLAVDEVFETMLNTVAVLVESHCMVIADRGEGSRRRRTMGIEAVVEFCGPPDGAVVLRCTTDCATGLARELLMLPVDEKLDLEQIKDALGECANMVSGSLTGRAFCGQQPSLGLPRIAAYQQADAAARCGSLVYRLSEGRVTIEVWLDNRR